MTEHNSDNCRRRVSPNTLAVLRRDGATGLEGNKGQGA